MREYIERIKQLEKLVKEFEKENKTLHRDLSTKDEQIADLKEELALAKDWRLELKKKQSMRYALEYGVEKSDPTLCARWEDIYDRDDKKFLSKTGYVKRVIFTDPGNPRTEDREALKLLVGKLNDAHELYLKEVRR